MGACRTVSTWIQEEILTPVEKFITDAKQVCENVGQWIEEKVWQPVSEWVSQQQRKCREQDCNWWCACCNKWFCWIVTVVVEVVTWVLVTVVKWVVKLVCKIVVTIIGIIIIFVLKVIRRLVTFVVCLVTDPLQALKTLWDLWNDITDLIDDLFDFITSLLDDIKGILHDIGELVDDLGRSFCIFGKAACAFFGAIFGFISGILNWLGDIVDWVRDTIDGIKDFIGGILTLNWCQIQLGLNILNVLRVIGSVTRIPAGWFYVGPKNLVTEATIEKIISDALEAAFANDPDRLERSKKRARLGGHPVGIPVTIDPRRMALRSSEWLQSLHKRGIINLHALAGRVSDCDGKFVFKAFNGEVVYTGTDTKVSQSDLDDFISMGPGAVPSFTVYGIKLATFKRYMQFANKKGFQIGLNLSWDSFKEVVVSDDNYVPLQSDDTDDTVQRQFLTFMGRPNTDEDISTVPSIAHFGFRDPDTHGLTSWYRPWYIPPDLSPSGTTFRTRFLEVVFRHVPIHEIGHYYGLDHKGHDNPSLIMFSPKSDDWHIEDAWTEFLLLSGEANFTEEDARTTWKYITTTDRPRDTILP